MSNVFDAVTRIACAKEANKSAPLCRQADLSVMTLKIVTSQENIILSGFLIKRIMPELNTVVQQFLILYISSTTLCD